MTANVEPQARPAIHAGGPAVAFLNYAVAAILAGSALYLAALRLFVPDQRVRFFTVFVLFVLSAVATVLLRTGRATAAVYTLTIGVWTYITVTSVFLGGISGTSVAMYPLVILLVGWLLNGRAAFAVAAVTAATALVFVVLEMTGRLPASPPTPAILRWIIQFFVWMLHAVLITHFLRAHQSHLDEVQALDRDLAGRTADLSRAQSVARVGSWVRDFATSTIQLSNEAARILGAGDDAGAADDPVFASIHAGDRTQVEQAWRHSLQTGDSFNSEHRIVVAGGVRWVRQSAELEIAGGGTPLRAVGIVQDVTERKSRELELQAARTQLAATLAAIPDLLFELGLNGECFLVHSPGEELLAAPRDQLYGRTVSDVLPPEAAEVCLAALREAHEHGRSLGGQLCLQLADGEHWFEVSVARKDSGRPGDPHFIMLSRDVTKRKMAEEALRRQEAQHRDTLQSAMDGYWLLDRDGRLQEVNDAYCSMSGYNVAELLGMHASALEASATAEESAAHLRRVEAGGQDRFEARHRRKDGRTYPVEVSIQYKPGGAGSFVAFVRDITERKHLQSQLSQAHKMESIGRLAGGVAHDFNNMLQAILGYTEMSLDEAGPEHPIHRRLLEIQKAAGRSALLTSQLLAFARKQPVVPKVIDLNHTVTGMLGMLERIIGEDITLQWRPAASPLTIKMDPGQIDQVLANLCVNARDAIGGVGTVVIRTDALTLDDSMWRSRAGVAPGEFISLQVSDTGCGMDQETLQNIFEPFFTTKGIGEGTGLGLAMVYGIVQQNSGFIDVSSEPGRGTTFTLYLPRHVERDARPGDLVSAAPRRGHETILVVEDEPAVLQLTTTVLARLGYQVLGAATPGEAFRLAERHAGQISLLLTDVTMPEMNGRELAAELLGDYPEMRCLFASGYPTLPDGSTFEDTPDLIRKPWSTADLAAKVRETLDG